MARKAGAAVGSEHRQGKGHVVRRMFADVDADIFVLVDGDATYDAPSAPKLVERLLSENLDMVVGMRRDRDEAAYRRGHRFGNRAAHRLRRPDFRRAASPTFFPAIAYFRAGS